MSNARNLANLLGTNTTIQTAKIADNAVTTAKMFSDFQNGITFAQTWRTSQAQSITGGSNTDFTGGWEAQDTDNAPSYGSNMTHSSGVFTFPSTGVYRVDANVYMRLTSGTTLAYFELYMKLSTDGGTSYSNTALNIQSITDSLDYGGMHDACLVDVTNTSNVKFKLTGFAQTGHTVQVNGDTGQSYCSLTFTKMSDT